jgi:hypothetical protein
MRQRVKVKERIEEKETTQTCQHYWVIEVANGPSSYGTCKYCGEKKKFLNGFPTFNLLKKNGSFLKLPKLSKIKVDKESES